MKESRRGRVQQVSDKASDAEQFEGFRQAARELGTDESEETFDRMLGKIAKAPPPKSVQKRKRAAKKPKRR